MSEPLKKIFPVCTSLLPADFWLAAEEGGGPNEAVQRFPERVAAFIENRGGPGYLPDLARIELARHLVQKRTQTPETSGEALRVNPVLELVEVAWSPLLSLLDGKAAEPEPSSQFLVFWRHPRTGTERWEVDGAEELLALKVVAEELYPVQVAAATGRPVGVIDAALEMAVSKGLLLKSRTRLRRGDGFPAPTGTPEEFLHAEVFTLQWHITQRCDLDCRHCYDRSARADVPLARGIEILDQLRTFCLRNHVRGQVSFSGGNPFLHPDFFQLYRAARDRNLNLAILGNPVSEEALDRLLNIGPPAFFQVSLEGLEEHNDLIRGAGNFASVLDFLDRLRKRSVFSMVMLTLTRDNLDQVLPLAELLRHRADLFTFNRLAMVGEGARLESPHPSEYRAFVRKFLEARKINPILSIKDSLINIELDRRKEDLFGGCTGFGCGAAFNFVSLLPDGQVHACRKFPSLIGNLDKQTLEDIYYSQPARSFRRGCRGCDACRLRPVCGGCLAVASGWGLDPLREKDPGCFLESADSRYEEPR